MLRSRLNEPIEFLPMRNSDRQESIKAGAIAALAALVTSVTMGWCNVWLAQYIPAIAQTRNLPQLELLSRLELWTGGLDVAIAVASAMLFGITYRYIASQQENPHLRSGAVGAFGLVRALAQVDIGIAEGEAWSVLAILGSESLLLFSIAALVLDACFQQNWVRLSGDVPPSNFR